MNEPTAGRHLVDIDTGEIVAACAESMFLRSSKN